MGWCDGASWLWYGRRFVGGSRLLWVALDCSGVAVGSVWWLWVAQRDCVRVPTEEHKSPFVKLAASMTPRSSRSSQETFAPEGAAPTPEGGDGSERPGAEDPGDEWKDSNYFADFY